MHSPGTNMSTRVSTLRDPPLKVRSSPLRANVFNFPTTISKIMAVRRQENQFRSGIFDRLPGGRDLVTRQIVCDDDVAGREQHMEHLGPDTDPG